MTTPTERVEKAEPWGWHAGDGTPAHPAERVAQWPEQNRKRMTHAVYAAHPPVEKAEPPEPQEHERTCATQLDRAWAGACDCRAETAEPPVAVVELNEHRQSVIHWLRPVEPATYLYAGPQGQAEKEPPIDMVLHCPACGMQHVDAPDDLLAEAFADAGYGIKRDGDGPTWKNPPHRSHLCKGCGHIWRPADVATNGVTAVKTKGKGDSPIALTRRDTDCPTVERAIGIIERAAVAISAPSAGQAEPPMPLEYTAAYRNAEKAGPPTVEVKGISGAWEAADSRHQVMHDAIMAIPIDIQDLSAIDARRHAANLAVEAPKTEKTEPPVEPPVRDDWQLVPKIATANMLQASWQFADPAFIACDHEYHIAKAWGAMLAAAPQVERINVAAPTAEPAPWTDERLNDLIVGIKHHKTLGGAREHVRAMLGAAPTAEPVQAPVATSLPKPAGFIDADGDAHGPIGDYWTLDQMQAALAGRKS